MEEVDTFEMKLDAALPNISQVQGMTRFQWYCVKRMLGRPRRFSPKFLADQQELLHRQVRMRVTLRGLALAWF